MENVGVRRTMNPSKRRDEPGVQPLAAGKSLGSALMSLQPESFARAPAAPAMRLIPQRTIQSVPSSSSLTAAGPASRQPAVPRKPPVPTARDVRERGNATQTGPGVRKTLASIENRNPSGGVKQFATLMSKPDVDIQMPSPPPLESRKVASVEQPQREVVEETVNRGMEVQQIDSDKVKLLENELEEHLKEKAGLREELRKKDSIIVALNEQVAKLKDDQGAKEQAMLGDLKQLEDLLQKERHEKSQAVERLSLEVENSARKMNEFNLQVESLQTEKSILERRLQDQVHKRSSAECMLVAQKEKMNSFEIIEEQLAQARIKASQRESALACALEENRQLSADNQRIMSMLDTVRKEAADLKEMQSALLEQLQKEREKVALQRGYLMKRGIDDI